MVRDTYVPFVPGGRPAFEVDDAVAAQMDGPKWGAPIKKIIWSVFPRSLVGASVPVDEDQARTLMKMIETLEDSDDVQSVSANFEVSDEILEKLSA